VLQPSRGLTATALAAVTALEQEVLAHDGGRLKLEPGVLATRPDDRVQDLLWWEDDRLVGYVGLQRFGTHPVELAGMVAPDARRRGVGTALLDAALGLLADLDDRRPPLLVVPAGHVGGRALARSRGARHAHDEHALALTGDPAPGVDDPRLTLAPAGPADVDDVARVLAAGFGQPAGDVAAALAAQTDRERTWVGRLDGAAVVTLRLSLLDGPDGPRGAVHGFAVDPAHQGRGLGRVALRRTCTHLRAAGAVAVGLEVETSNDRALGLYRSVGFEPVGGEEYWALPAP